MGANLKILNIGLRVGIVNHIIFLALNYINISNCSNSPYGCSPEKGLSEMFLYLMVFGLLAIIEGAVLLSLLVCIIDKSILKVTQLNAFAFLVTLILCVYRLLDLYYSHM